MSRLLMHYAIPSKGLPQLAPQLAKVGIAYVAMFAWRCGSCNSDFHLDKKPSFCPVCGTKFTREERFGKGAA
jgi:rRNA maturation endonuclease Nob1